MSKAILTFGTGEPFIRLMEITAPIWKEYCSRHGYEFLSYQTEISHGRPQAWTKIPLIESALERYSEVLWVDADCIPFRLDLDIADEVSPGSELAWVIHEVDGEQCPNTGVLYLKSSPRVFELLHEVWNQEDLIFHQWWENAAFIRLIGPSHTAVSPGTGRLPSLPRTQVLDSKWNSIPQARSQQTVFRHFPGVRGVLRELMMSEVALAGFEEIRSANPTWERRVFLIRSEAISQLDFSLRKTSSNLEVLAIYVRRIISRFLRRKS